MSVPSISVIVPSFNAARWIGEALESVLAQGIRDLQVLVVDDGSNDSTVAIAKSFDGVTVVPVDHGGPSRARNIGTQLSTGAFVQYLDADDLLAPGKLERQRHVLEQTGADVAYGDWRRTMLQPDGSWLEVEVVRRTIDGDPEIALLSDFWCPPAAYLFRRAIVAQVREWNESLPIIQDARFVLDCALCGGRFAYCDGMMADYRIHSQQSVSRGNPTAFYVDCLRNGEQVEEWWRHHGGLTAERLDALTGLYNHVARVNYGRDDALFEQAYSALKRLHPGRIPGNSRAISLLSGLIGYKGAEALAYRYRAARANLSAALKS